MATKFLIGQFVMHRRVGNCAGYIWQVHENGEQVRIRWTLPPDEYAPDLTYYPAEDFLLARMQAVPLGFNLERAIDDWLKRDN